MCLGIGKGMIVDVELVVIVKGRVNGTLPSVPLGLMRDSFSNTGKEGCKAVSLV